MTTKTEAISASVQLTPEQRQALAAALKIDIAFVPQELGVLGVPETQARTMGMLKDMRGRFAPSLVML